VQRHRWTDLQFDEMSWHDNHVHSFRVTEGDHGAGRLILDIDYIIGWLQEAGETRFRIIPATLTFLEVTNLKLRIDYATPTAGLMPFSIDSLQRITEERERYVAQIWKMPISWPDGEISFEATGFEQIGRGLPLISTQQWLNEDDRQ
jgi:hypothetical protein